MSAGCSGGVGQTQPSIGAVNSGRLITSWSPGSPTGRGLLCTAIWIKPIVAHANGVWGIGRLGTSAVGSLGGGLPSGAALVEMGDSPPVCSCDSLAPLHGIFCTPKASNHRAPFRTRATARARSGQSEATSRCLPVSSRRRPSLPLRQTHSSGDAGPKRLPRYFSLPHHLPNCALPSAGYNTALCPFFAPHLLASFYVRWSHVASLASPRRCWQTSRHKVCRAWQIRHIPAGGCAVLTLC